MTFINFTFFDENMKTNNDWWLCISPPEIPNVIHTKYPANVIVLWVVSSKVHIMLRYIFLLALRRNAVGNNNDLKTVAKIWTDKICNGKQYGFQQDSASFHIVIVTQNWLSDKLCGRLNPHISILYKRGASFKGRLIDIIIVW